MKVRLPVYVIVMHPINQENPDYWCSKIAPTEILNQESVYRFEVEIEEPSIQLVKAGKRDDR